MPSLPPSGGSTRGGGPISELQEYVQSDRRFPVSSNQPVLKWDWDNRMANAVTLEFRATVSFVLAGVPHHAAGAWHTSKKAAQRDAAERVLTMFRSQQNTVSRSVEAGKDDALCAPEMSAVKKLEGFCASLSGKEKADPLSWMCFETATGYQAAVEVCVFGDVVHTLQGAVCGSEQDAYEDTAHRALWYLRAPSHLNAFEASYREVVNETLQLPPDRLWLREGHTSDSQLYHCEAQQRAAQQKTTLMRVQNQLQKRYGKILPSGTAVWKWSFEYQTEPLQTNDYQTRSQQTSEYEVGQHLASALKRARGNHLEAGSSVGVSVGSSAAQVSPEPCRATVWIAGVDKEFQGQWCRGQKAAQLDTCTLVAEFLEEEVAKEKNDSRL